MILQKDKKIKELFDISVIGFLTPVSMIRRFLRYKYSLLEFFALFYFYLPMSYCSRFLGLDRNLEASQGQSYD